MRFCLFVSVLVFVQGCRYSFEEARVYRFSKRENEEYCIRLDEDIAKWGFLAKFSGFASGASGISSVSINESEKKIYLNIGSALLASFSVGAIFVEQKKSENWIRKCSK